MESLLVYLPAVSGVHSPDFFSSATVLSKPKGRAETSISALCLVTVKQCNRMNGRQRIQEVGHRKDV